MKLFSFFPLLLVVGGGPSVSIADGGGVLHQKESANAGAYIADSASNVMEDVRNLKSRKKKKPKKPKKPKSLKTPKSSKSSTGCAADIVSNDVDCDLVADLKWFLSTGEGILSLQGLTKGLSIEQIKQRGTSAQDLMQQDVAHVAVAVDSDESGRTLKKKKKKTKAPAPTLAPTSPGEKLSKCAHKLDDPLLDCDTIASMMWFLTTDEGIAFLQGFTEGLDTERLIQREAIYSVYKDLNIFDLGTSRRNLEVSFVGNECDWIGITCDSNGKTLEIELNGKNLSGTVSSKIEKLRLLTVLDLGSNSLNGQIQSQIGSLGDLNYLDLSSNQFSGSVPSELQNLSNLKVLNLAGNRLGGILPFGLGDLQNLEILYLHENEFTGSFPEDVCLPLRDNGAIVSSDCFGSPPKIFCEFQTCCNECYPVTTHPSMSPSSSPSMQPSLSPSSLPSMQPSLSPSSLPSMQPSLSPSSLPSMHPSSSSLPSMQPSSSPSGLPSIQPSMMPSVDPWQQQGDDLDGDSPGDQFGFSVSLSSSGTFLAISARRSDGTATDSGLVRVFEWKTSSWDQKGGDIDGITAGVQSGYSVSISDDGNTVAIGRPFYDGGSTGIGQVRVYEWDSDTSNWIQKGSDLDGDNAYDYSGISVSLSTDGNIVAIGARYYDPPSKVNAGHVRVYEWNDVSNAWVQRGADILGNAAEDWYGHSVSMSNDGSVVAIGGFNDDGDTASSAGHVRVYDWNEGSTAWVQRGSVINGEATNDRSGYSVSLSSDGTVVAIGAPLHNATTTSPDNGHVRVYDWDEDSTAWVQRGSAINGEATDDQSGFSVSLSDDGSVVAIGAPFNDDSASPDAGHVRVYEWNEIDSEWKRKGTDIDGKAADDWSGYSVSLSGDGSLVAIGAPFNATSASDAGYVRVYNFVE